MLQEKLLRFNVICTIWMAQIFGLWPFFYNKTSKKYQTTWYFQMYPLVVSIALITGILYSLQKLSSTNFLTAAANIISNLLIFFCVITFLGNYLIQYMHFNKIQNLIENGSAIFKKSMVLINNSNIVFMDRLKLYMVKIVFCQLAYIFSEFVKIQNLLIVKDVSYVPIIFLSILFFIIGFIPNVYYGSILTSTLLFKELNQKIIKVVNSATDLTYQQRKYYRMKSFCELSDSLDSIAILHYDLCTLTKRINKIFSLQLLGWVTFKYMYNLVELFLCYILACRWITQSNTLETRKCKIF